MQVKVETWVGLFVLAALGVLAYMGFQIGAFRFDRMRYQPYTLTFKDVSGLSRKAIVKIAGVKVGWVEKLDLVVDGDPYAQAEVMINKEYPLYIDAYAIVRQDGLLGPKYLEIYPGDANLPKLKPGQPLAQPSIAPVSIDDLLHQVQKISSNVECVTDSLKQAIGGIEGEEQLKSIVSNITIAAERISHFSETLDRSFSGNDEHIQAFIEIGTTVRRLSDQLETSVIPTFNENVEKISNAVDRDFNRIATKLESTADVLEDASLQARDGFKNVSSIAEKIDEGRGVIGKLINDDETYRDLRTAVQGLRNYFAKTDMLQIVFDSHWEAMHRTAENYAWEDSKGYFDVRIHPSEDYFYLVEIATSERGFISRNEKFYDFMDECGNIINPYDQSDDAVGQFSKFKWAYRRQKTSIKRNTFKIGLQVGKVFNYIAARFGLFDGWSAGVAVDIDIPFESDRFRWLMSFEAFDMRGWNRIDDRRPHLKWLNKVYLLNNIYTVFGADDFISKKNANVFFGAGLRFGDDDVKYLLPSVSGFAFN